MLNFNKIRLKNAEKTLSSQIILHRICSDFFQCDRRQKMAIVHIMQLKKHKHLLYSLSMVNLEDNKSLCEYFLFF